MRIYTPKHAGDKLYSFRLEDYLLAEIDRKLVDLYVDHSRIEKQLTNK